MPKDIELSMNHTDNQINRRDALLIIKKCLDFCATNYPDSLQLYMPVPVEDCFGNLMMRKKYIRHIAVNEIMSAISQELL